LLFSAAIGLPLIAQAAERSPGVQAGISAGATSGAYAHYDVKPLVVPAISWQGQRFFASPGSLGMYLYKGEGLRLSATVTPYTLRFKTDDVNDPQLRRLHSRQLSAMAGINAGVVGILVSALYDPVWTSAIHGKADFGLALLSFGLLTVGRVPPALVVLLAGLAGWVMAMGI